MKGREGVGGKDIRGSHRAGISLGRCPWPQLEFDGDGQSADSGRKAQLEWTMPMKHQNDETKKMRSASHVK